MKIMPANVGKLNMLRIYKC